MSRIRYRLFVQLGYSQIPLLETMDHIEFNCVGDERVNATSIYEAAYLSASSISTGRVKHVR